MSKHTLFLIAALSSFIAVLLVLAVSSIVEAKEAAANKKNKKAAKKDPAATKSEQQMEPETPSASASASHEDAAAAAGIASVSAEEDEESVEAPFAPAASKSMNRNLHIKGGLANVTRTVRDPRTGHARKVMPSDVARIALNGGSQVFFSDSHGAFHIHVPVPNSASSGGGNVGAPRVFVHSLDIDWIRMAFPRIVVEVDEFANFRAYVDGDGRILASRGKFGVDPKSRRQFEVVDDINEDTEYQYANQFLQISALGEMEYFIPRQEFSVLAFVKQPMVLMMLVTGFMVVVMPKLMDPAEMKQQMKELQKMKDDATGGGAASATAVKDKK